MKRDDKIRILEEYKETKELVAAAEKRVRELKAQIQAEIDAGKYGDYVLVFEEREVKEYVVPARTDRIVKVSNIKESL